MTEKVLFVCVHNSARSQMAEAFLNQLGTGRFEAYSAGIEPGSLNLVVVAAMREAGIDISRNETKSVFDLFKKGTLYNYVITVCDETAAEKCPVFPGIAKRLHWGFPDPAGFKGNFQEKLAQTKAVRDQIKSKIESFLEESKSVR